MVREATKPHYLEPSFIVVLITSNALSIKQLWHGSKTNCFSNIAIAWNMHGFQCLSLHGAFLIQSLSLKMLLCNTNIVSSMILRSQSSFRSLFRSASLFSTCCADPLGSDYGDRPRSQYSYIYTYIYTYIYIHVLCARRAIPLNSWQIRSSAPS